MNALFPLLVALVAGIGVAVQSPSNAALARSTGSVWLAALWSFAIGTATLLAIWAVADRTPIASVRAAPWWTWLGGFYGAWFVAAFAFATPRLGLAVALTVAVAAQLAAALVIDHFGLLGLARAPVSAGRVAGLLLVLAGVVLVRRG